MSDERINDIRRINGIRRINDIRRTDDVRRPSRSEREAQRAPYTVSHVADRYVPYPGEDVTFYTRVRVRRDLPTLTLRVSLGEGLRPGETWAPAGAVPRLLADSAVERGVSSLIWDAETLAAGETYEVRVVATVEPTDRDAVLKSRATVTAGTDSGGADSGGPFSAGETASVAVSAKGSSLRHLPALYERDELMGRFLMLFESFWEPIERRIEQLPFYFDPKMTPPDFLPWLASWLGVVLADHLSETQRRRLIRSALMLYRRRGTRQGLQTYLEILGEKAQIIEHRATSFRLGPEARLGPGIALGQSDRPHTFTVVLRSLPGASTGQEEDAYRAQVRLQTVKAAIEAEKPAHTAYVLRFEPDSD